MKNITLDSFIEQRIKENQELFTKEEFECIEEHKGCMKKLYLLGFMNAKQCYERGT